jgi:hypothetical protein
VRDFIRQSRNIPKFSVKGSDFTALETFVRLRLAELIFARSEDVQRYYGWEDLFRCFAYRPALDTMLNGYKRAFNHHNGKGLDPPPMSGFTVNWSRSIYRDNVEPVSFLHFLACYGCAGYIHRELRANPDQLSSRGHLSLLLSAAVGSSTATVKALLDAGASPYDLITSQSRGSEDLKFTV